MSVYYLPEIDKLLVCTYHKDDDSITIYEDSFHLLTIEGFTVANKVYIGKL